jgi:hypothetical protein
MDNEKAKAKGNPYPIKRIKTMDDHPFIAPQEKQPSFTSQSHKKA